MIKDIKKRVWAFDLEWVPDRLAGRLLQGVPEPASEEETMRAMWQHGGADEENPTPFLKTVVCRVVSAAAVERLQRPSGEVNLRLMSLPHDPDDDEQMREKNLIGTFLEALGSHRPQLVGYNSRNSDLKILVQRGLLLGVAAAEFCRRPDKPWEGIDYFARGSDWNVDLMDIVGGWGTSMPSLHEVAVQSGVPGKLDVDGDEVARLWLDGERRRIIEYNEYDALTTYLVWLRLAYFAGHLDAPQYADEQQQLEALVETEIAGDRPHLERYLDEWRRLRAIVEQAR